MYVSKNPPKDMIGGYDLKSSHRLVVSSGAVTTIAARTATAGHIFSFRWSSSTSVKCYVKYVGAKFTLTTAYTTAQETGCDLILARGYTASHTGATAVDVGSTVADTNNLFGAAPTSLIVANAVRVADTGALTAGTQTLDANPIGILSGWSTGIGDTVPDSASGASEGFGTLFSARETGMPIKLVQDEGFVIRNLILQGAVGVGRWDFCVEWDEGTAQSV